jgi:hypothetical protein
MAPIKLYKQQYTGSVIVQRGTYKVKLDSEYILYTMIRKTDTSINFIDKVDRKGHTEVKIWKGY